MCDFDGVGVFVIEDIMKVEVEMCYFFFFWMNWFGCFVVVGIVICCNNYNG